MNQRHNSAYDTPPKASGIRKPWWDLLTTRNFACLWFSQAISQIGDGVTKVALVWFVYELTGSVFKMTVVGLLQTIPPLFLGPLIGVYIDRLPKKPVLIWVDFVRAFLIVLIPGLYMLEALTLERLYCLIFFTAIFSTAFGPALASGIPLLVKPSQLMAANALIQSTTNIGILVGPACSGLMIAIVGTHNVLYIDAATFVLSAFCLMGIRSPGLSVVRRSPGEESGLSKELRTGVQFVFREEPTILGLVVITIFYTLGASAFVYLLPVFVKDHLELDSVWLGGLWSSLGVGMLLASCGLTWIKQAGTRKRLHIIAGAMSIGAALVFGLTLLPSPALALVMVGVIGGSSAVFTPIVWSLLQEMTPGNLRGRVFTLVSTAGMASAAAGIPAVGWMADTVGPSIGFFGIAFALLSTAMISVGVSQRENALKKNAQKTRVVRNAQLHWTPTSSRTFRIIPGCVLPVTLFRKSLIRRNWPLPRQYPVPQSLSGTRAPPGFEFTRLGNGEHTLPTMVFQSKIERCFDENYDGIVNAGNGFACGMFKHHRSGCASV